MSYTGAGRPFVSRTQGRLKDWTGPAAPVFVNQGASVGLVGDDSAVIHSYRAFGLTIASELFCPELLPAAGFPQVRVCCGPVPDHLEASQYRASHFETGAGEVLLKADGVAKYLVSAGAEIVIEPAAGVQESALRLFLLGPALAALLQQRGLLPLHGCAVEVQGEAAVFLGVSGSGKSTLAGALGQRGYRILADDITAISFTPAGSPQVETAYPQLKLGADVLGKLGAVRERCSPLLPGAAKFAVPLEEGHFARGPAPLGRVYELRVGACLGLESAPLQGFDALSVFLRHTYRPQFLTWTLGRQGHLEQCARLSRHTWVKRLSRSRDGWQLAELVALLEDDWAAGAGQGLPRSRAPEEAGFHRAGSFS